jgi:hypothetical protein
MRLHRCDGWCFVFRPNDGTTAFSEVCRQCGIGSTWRDWHRGTNAPSRTERWALLQTAGLHSAVVPGWVVLGETVSQIEFSGGPEDIELALVDAILHPQAAHVEGFGALLSHLGIGGCHVRFDCRFRGVIQWQVVCGLVLQKRRRRRF